jgi:hypothetical protein
MALPKLKTSEYTLTLPSTQEEIKFRPFLVREQKILMIAQESEEDNQIADAMGRLVSDCTFGAVDGNVNPMFDLEYVFLQMRGKSVGNEVKLSLVCPDDDETRVDVDIDLSKVDVQMNLEHSQNIKITDEISINFRYPRLKDIENISVEKGDFEQSIDMILNCIESVQNQDELIHRIDMTKDEIMEFIDSMSSDQMESVMQFFETMPKLRHVVEVKNPKTKVKSEILLEGMQSFLE